MRARDQALGQDRPGTDVHLTEDHRGAGDLRLGLIDEHLIEAHGLLTVLLAVRASRQLIPTLRAHKLRLVTPPGRSS